jgi:hypothetical protein
MSDSEASPVNGLINAAPLLLYCNLIPYAIPAVMPDWRWLMMIALAISVPLSALWIYDWILTSDPLHHEGAGDGLGRAFSMLATASFVIGVAVRAIALLLRALGMRRCYAVMIGIAGLTIAPAFVSGAALWR